MDNDDVKPRKFPDRALYKWAHLETRSDWKNTQNREDEEKEEEGKGRTQRRTKRREEPNQKIEDTGQI